MRLRYLHLPRCGPLTDTAVVFGREELIDKILNSPRKGSLNFVVGVNGSGKSSLLRAIYHIFSALKRNEFPALPLTIAWDVASSEETFTAFLHIPVDKREKAFFDVLACESEAIGKIGWSKLTADLKIDPGTVELGKTIKYGDDVLGSYLQAHLPKRLIAYTSGAADPWVNLDQPILHPGDEEASSQTEDERPQGWSMDREWDAEKLVRIDNILRSEKPGTRPHKGGGFETSVNMFYVPTSDQAVEPQSETVERLRQELGPMGAIRQKVISNRLPRTERLDDSYFRIQTPHLRFAGITLALLQTARELADCAEESQREALRNRLLQRHGSDEKPADARRVLNEIDWFWPTHLSLTYHDADDRASPRQHQELLCLVALADEVIAQPGGRQRAVFSLGPSDRISLTENLKDAFPLGIPSKTIEFIAERVDGSKTGAEAILRIFSEDKNLDSTLMDVFARLRDWERTGLLEDITLTIKRLHRPAGSDGDLDDIIVTYDQLSDGEQMLLGRMGLFFLLRGQDGSLLLLDEPETHFNDVWKRELVEMVDTALLNSTAANVIISTHTSIALTDAFAAEVTVLSKRDGHATARGVGGGLFGTDPGEVNMNLFGADGSTGRHSEELLDRLLKVDWTGKEDDLDAILKVLGSSFHRAELRAILKQLRNKHNGASST